MSARAECTTAAPALVVFDLGEVLSSAPGLHPRLAEVIGVPAVAVEREYWKYREAYDRGGPAGLYWGTLLDELGVVSEPEIQAALSRIDSQAWTTIRPAAALLLRDVFATGIPIAILSNAPVALGALARATPWARYITHWCFSGDIGAAKPDAEIYRHLTAAAGVAPGRITFIDDRQANVVAARAAGWVSHRWRSDSSTRRILIDAGVLNGGGESALVVQVIAGVVHVDGHPVALGDRERDVMLELVRAGGDAVSAERLCRVAWGEHPGIGDRNLLKTTIHRLRKHLARVDPRARDLVRTHRNHGYSLVN